MSRANELLRYRCPHCRETCEPEADGEWLVSNCCDEVVERYFLCETCESREAHPGCDDCIQCVADAFIENPSAFIGTEKLKAEIADELAKRLRPFLTRKQAA